MRECSDCGRLYPDAETACPHDGTPLATPDDIDPHLGRIVGSYVLAQKLGSGGMGHVYLGEHPEIGSRVAIKILNERFATDSVIVERFFNEARAANLIGHENIVQIFDFGRLPEGTPYFIMEWLHGEPLSARMERAVPLDEAIAIVLQITAALQAAHDAGIVHRDLKPDNIFVVPRQQGLQVKVLDFGIAKLSASTPTPGTTQSGIVLGTARYLSPEQAAGDAAHVNAASDIYSLGVILYQLTTGQLPFDEPTFAETLAAHLRQTPRPPRDLVPEVSTELEAIVLRCLEKKPEDRFPSMRAVEEALGSLPSVTSDVQPAPRQRLRWILPSIAILLAPVVGWTIAWVTKPKPVPPAIQAHASPSPTPAPTPEPTPVVAEVETPPPSPSPTAKPQSKKEKKAAVKQKTVGKDGVFHVDF